MGAQTLLNRSFYKSRTTSVSTKSLVRRPNLIYVFDEALPVVALGRPRPTGCLRRCLSKPIWPSGLVVTLVLWQQTLQCSHHELHHPKASTFSPSKSRVHGP
jgi:hypothetical protein